VFGGTNLLTRAKGDSAAGGWTAVRKRQSNVVNMLTMPRAKALAACGIALLALIFLPSVPPARILLLGFLIAAAGCCALLVVVSPAALATRGACRPAAWGFVGIALGASVVLASAVILRLFGLYSFASAIGALIFVICITCTNLTVCRSLFRLARSARSYIVGYLVYAIAVAAVVSVEHFPRLSETAGYLTQGFDLFLPKDPSEWPYFGERFALPLMYVTHTIGTIFALFSHGDQFEYYTLGQYWLNILLAPLLPIGAYLFFRRHLPWWAAIAASLGFCWSILAWRVWSIRGETLGWIFGFAFLLTLQELISRLRTGVTRAHFRITMVLVLLFVTMALAHGVAAMLATFIAAGLAVHFLLTQPARVVAAAKVGVVFAAGVLCLFVIYAYAFSGDLRFSRLILNYEHVPEPGSPDAAHLIENALFYPAKFPVPPVHAAPPLLPASDALQITAFVPLSQIWRPSFFSLYLAEFPNNVMMALDRIPPLERGVYLALLLGCCFLHATRTAGAVRAAPLFWASAATYVLIVAFALHLDYASVSSYPFAASRRTYKYAAFFYCLAVATTVLDRAFIRRLSDKLSQLVPRFLHARRARAVEVLLLFTSLSLTVLWSISASGGSLSWSSTFDKIATRAFPDADAKKPEPYDGAEAQFRPLFEAVAYVRDHTAPGEWVFSNVVSDNQFWYLSGGRYSLAEGSVMYQVYELQKRAAARIVQFAHFAETANAALIDSFGPRLIMLYKYCKCRTPSCLGYHVLPTRIGAFAENPGFAKVFENGEFIVFGREHPPGGGEVPLPGSQPPDAMPDCYQEDGAPYAATLAEGIVFARVGRPEFIASVQGLGDAEAWGRWSVDDEVTIRFRNYLPTRFTLRLKAHAFGPNVGKAVIVAAGRTQREFTVQRDGVTSEFQLDFDLSERASALVFKIPAPTSPSDVDPHLADQRRVGIGFIDLRIDERHEGVSERR
jgi:Domain of unknown function (DUF7024)